MAAVSYRHVWKRFGATTAVNDLTLEIEDGEFMILVGPSGCGKTTALRMLAGLEEVTEGEVELAGRTVTNVPASERDIAMVFQNYALYPHMTVYENMAFPLAMRRRPKAEVSARVREAAATLGLGELLDKRPAQLSGGQRQRVALGRALVRNPDVFLLDEPLSNLDAQLRVDMRVHLQRLHRELGTTFIYVTHDQVEAMTMGDRIAVMRDGILQQVATPREIYARPANMYVAGFIGTPRMNFIPAAVTDRVAKASGFTIELPVPLPDGEYVLGIRPDQITETVGRGDRAHAAVELDVDVIEMLGSDQYLYGRIGRDDVVARVDANLRVNVRDRIMLGIDVMHLCVFEPGGGKLVAAPGEAAVGPAASKEWEPLQAATAENAVAPGGRRRPQ